MTKALVAQWIERLPSKQVVASSILAVGVSITYFLHFYNQHEFYKTSILTF